MTGGEAARGGAWDVVHEEPAGDGDSLLKGGLVYEVRDGDWRDKVPARAPYRVTMSTRHDPDFAPCLGDDGLSPVEQGVAERIAAEVARRLGGGGGPETGSLIDAGEVARILGCERSWVYEHQRELGVIRLGNGSRPRLRFERERIAEIASAPARQPAGPRRAIPGRRRARRSTAPLLEIKGRR